MEVGQTRMLEVSVKGGVIPIKAEWKIDGKIVSSFESSDLSKEPSFGYSVVADKPSTGAVLCELTDNLGRVVTSTVATLTINDKAENG